MGWGFRLALRYAARLASKPTQSKASTVHPRRKLALMNLYGKSWPTYTVGYGSSFSGDELVDGAATARELASVHTPVTLTRSTFEAALPKIVACLEEPVATSSIVPMYFVCERAKQDVKVALIGQGLA